MELTVKKLAGRLWSMYPLQKSIRFGTCTLKMHFFTDVLPALLCGTPIDEAADPSVGLLVGQIVHKGPGHYYSRILGQALVQKLVSGLDKKGKFSYLLMRKH